MEITGKIDLNFVGKFLEDDETDYLSVKASLLLKHLAENIEQEILMPNMIGSDIVITPTQVELIAGFFSTEKETCKIVWSHKEFLLENCWTLKRRNQFVAALEKMIEKAKALEYDDRGEEIKGIGTKVPSVLD